MVSFMCQLDWTTGCPAIWSNIFLGVFVLLSFDTWFSRQSKVDCPPGCGWASSNRLGAWIEQQQQKTEQMWIYSLWFMVFKLWHRFSFAFRLRLELELYHWLCWDSSLTIADLGILSFHSHMSQLLITNLFIYKEIGFVSLEKPG